MKMKKPPTGKKTHRLLAFVATFALAACALAFPAAALAEETGVAHTVDSNGMRHYYATVNEAKEVGYSGATVYMDADWDLGSGSLDIADSKSLTIQMAGHKITSSNKDATIYLNEHASLRITSYEDAKDYSFNGFAQNGSSWEWQDLMISASGLITNTNRGIRTTSFSGTRYSSCGIHLEGSSSLSLENVAVVGCPGRGIDAGSKCNIALTNAKVCYNRTPSDGDRSNGAGVSIKSGSTLSMNASHIDNNYASEALGGGIYAEKSTTVALENGSTVSDNLSGGGGGVYFNSTYFTLKSDDRSGVVSGNTAWKSSEAGTDAEQSGGGIHVNSATGDNKGTIEGITIKDNYSRYDGGGIELDQRWTTVKDCIIAGNYSDYDGGGIYVNGGNNAIESCTIRDNYCNGIGKNQEGGGIFVSCHYDVKMAGMCVVKGNTRGKDSGNADDVFLSTLSGGGAKAYIKGSLASGSSVGVRTGIEGDRRIASGFNPESKDCLFIDLSGYYVSYGTDEGGDAWQRHTTKEFAVKVNGDVVGKYRNGTAVTLEAPSAGAGKAFKCWSADGSTGLYPFADYVKDANSSTLTFVMPQNDVNLTAVYADAKPAVTSVEGVAVSVAAAEDEQVLRDLLPATAQATTDAGTTVTLKVKKDGFDLGSLIQNGCVVPPAGSDAAVLEIPVESADGSVTVPEGTTVKVTVRITGNGDGDGPEVPVFPDVDYSQWYADGVAFCSGNGLMTGYEEGDDAGMFGVGRSLTRAELASILWRIADPEASQAYVGDAANATGMADVADGAWYTGAANWAVEAGVVNGFDEGDHREFRPDAPVTAEQLAAILANYADPDGAAFADLGVLAEFSDADAISDWARGSVAWAKGKGVVNGYDAGYYRLLMPQEEIPRERVATILMNAFEGGVLR